MDRTVLVTGGSGFAAGWVIVELLRKGYRVRATLRDLSRADELRRAIAAVAPEVDRLGFVEADLGHDAGWDDAARGCDGVLHVASPLGGRGETEEAMLKAAVDGTLRVLGAATRAGAGRIVVTSSCAAASPRDQTGDTVSDETTWTDPSNPALTPYRRSKVLAERAAWEWMTANSDPRKLVTILPAAIFGPVLTKKNLGSVGLINGLLNGRPPAIPRVSFNVIDVRDLAALHVAALESPEAGGERLIAAGKVMWMEDVADVLRKLPGGKGSGVPGRAMPDWFIRLGARLSPALRDLRPMLGRRHSFSSAKARAMLGFEPRPAEETIRDCADSLTGAWQSPAA